MPFFLAIRAFLGRIPKWAWLALAIGIALFLGVRWYHNQIHAAYDRGVIAERTQAKAAADRLKAEIDTKTRQIADLLRRKSDEQARHIAVAADDLRLSGPGKVSFRCSGSSTAPSGRNQASGQGNAPRVEMPSEERAVLPWDWVVGQAERCDLNRSEVLAWRTWYQEIEKAWPK